MDWKNIPFTGLKSNAIKIILLLLSTGLIGSFIYTFSSSEEQKAEVTKAKDEVQTPTNLNLTVNNIINNLPTGKPQASTTIVATGESVVVIPMELKTPATVKLTDMSLNKEPKTTDDAVYDTGTSASPPPKLPKMAVIDDSTSSTTSNQENAISGVNSAIGTGQIASKIDRLKNPFTLFAGEVIPITMDTPINSDKPGLIRATVSRNVFDSVTLKYLLIPMGSKIVGVYDNKVAYGTNRLMVGWNRLIYPNGSSINLKGQPGTSLKGFSGFADDVDNHYDKIFGAAFVTGAIFGAQTYMMGNQSSNPYDLSAGATISQQIGGQMANTGVQIIQKGLDIPPTIIISEGFMGGVALTQDLVLKKYIFVNRVN